MVLGPWCWPLSMRPLVMASPLFFTCAAGVLSTLVEFPSIIKLTAASKCSQRMGKLLLVTRTMFNTFRSLWLCSCTTWDSILSVENVSVETFPWFVLYDGNSWRVVGVQSLSSWYVLLSMFIRWFSSISWHCSAIYSHALLYSLKHKKNITQQTIRTLPLITGAPIQCSGCAMVITGFDSSVRSVLFSQHTPSHGWFIWLFI